MRRKLLIERPFVFGSLTMATSVLIGVMQDKTLEQQVVNVILGFTAGALLSCLILLGEYLWRRRGRT